MPMKQRPTERSLPTAYSAKAKLVGMFFVQDNAEIMLRTTNGRAMIFDTALLMPKSTRDTIGVQVHDT